MSTARTITINSGERQPGARSCAADPAVGRCSCGWSATGRDVAAETMDHLYGDLRGAAREFAYRG